MILNHEQDSIGLSSARFLNGNDVDVINTGSVLDAARVMGTLPVPFESGDAGAGVQDLINFAAERGGNIREFQLRVPLAAPGKNLTRNFVGVNDGKIAINNDARAAELTQHVREHGV